MHLTYYVAARDETTERDVDPVRLRWADGRWYLEAWCRSVGAMRFFRIDRVDAVEILDEPSAPPADAVPRDLSEGVYQPAPEHPLVTLRLDQPGRWVADYYPCETASPLARRPARGDPARGRPGLDAPAGARAWIGGRGGGPALAGRAGPGRGRRGAGGVRLTGRRPRPLKLGGGRVVAVVVLIVWLAVGGVSLIVLAILGYGLFSQFRRLQETVERARAELLPGVDGASSAGPLKDGIGPIDRPLDGPF